MTIDRWIVTKNCDWTWTTVSPKDMRHCNYTCHLGQLPFGSKMVKNVSTQFNTVKLTDLAWHRTASRSSRSSSSLAPTKFWSFGFFGITEIVWSSLRNYTEKIANHQHIRVTRHGSKKPHGFQISLLFNKTANFVAQTAWLHFAPPSSVSPESWYPDPKSCDTCQNAGT